MDDNLAIFLVLTMSIVAAVVIMIATSWTRIRLRSAGQADAALAQGGEVALLGEENAALRTQIVKLEERLAVLERIATDPAERTAREIELLR